ncbi:MAG TPA: M23 family metallopeptidase, partial [Bacteroidia bacterium]|nr:M23 family metallopeptidase [Bacteroidia bacterium]
HSNNLMSIYKHNSDITKNIGDHVKAGEPIAIIGNTGETSSGTHLHFELWYNGTPINPQDYVLFLNVIKHQHYYKLVQLFNFLYALHKVVPVYINKKKYNNN